MLYLRKTQELAVRNLAARLLNDHRSYSKDYDSSDDEKDVKKSKKEKPLKVLSSTTGVAPDEESVSSKLNRVLASMQTDQYMNLNKDGNVIAKPGEGNKKKKQQLKEQTESKDILAAAKRVASLLGEENKQLTESELLSRLLGGKAATSPSSTGAPSTDDSKASADVSLSELIVGMKIDRSQPQNEMATRGDYVRRSIASKGSQQHYRNQQQHFENNRRPMQRSREAAAYTGSVNLFDSKPLGIFTDPTQLKQSADLLPTWSYLQEEALRIQISHPPSNYFDKMALWTEQGKVWRFPIDNEQDWLDEKDVDFSEHIFLEQHLEGWCPNKGPIRHFMELVCVGLSKNPYITAQDKKDHILWYRDYFEGKKEILKDLIMDETKTTSSKGNKQVEA